MTAASRTSSIAGYRLTYRLERIKLRRGASYTIVVRIESPNGAEEAAVHDVCRNRREAERLFAAVAEGFVTPCTLADVLEDLL